MVNLLTWRYTGVAPTAKSIHGGDHSAWVVVWRDGGLYAELQIRDCVSREIIETVTIGPYTEAAQAKLSAEASERIGVAIVGADCDCDPLADVG